MSHLAAHPRGEAFDFERAPPSIREERLRDAAVASLLRAMGAAPASSPPARRRSSPVAAADVRDAPRFSSLMSMLHFFVRRVGQPGAFLARLRLHRGPRGESFPALFRLHGETLTLYEVDADDGVRALRRFRADPRSNDWFLHLPARLNDDDLFVR